MKQYEEALVTANEVRLARAELKREVKAGKASVGELLAEVELPAWLLKMPLDQLLDALPRFQQKEIERIQFETPIKGGALIGDLTYRKRRMVADRVAKWEAGAAERSEKRARPKYTSTHATGQTISKHRARNARRIA